MQVFIVLALLTLASGCTTFNTVRSAVVRPGRSVTTQVAGSTRVGPETGWFYSFDCASNCNRAVSGADLGMTFGSTARRTTPAVALGFGINGLYPYVDGYIQLGQGSVPFGIGGRVGIPLGSWHEHQVYARTDVPLSKRARLLLNPGLFIHSGRAPNGASPGSFVAFAPGIGLMSAGQTVSPTVAVTMVTGRSQRNSYGREYYERTTFAALSLGLTFHHER